MLKESHRYLRSRQKEKKRGRARQRVGWVGGFKQERGENILRSLGSLEIFQYVFPGLPQSDGLFIFGPEPVAKLQDSLKRVLPVLLEQRWGCGLGNALGRSSPNQTSSLSIPFPVSAVAVSFLDLPSTRLVTVPCLPPCPGVDEWAPWGRQRKPWGTPLVLGPAPFPELQAQHQQTQRGSGSVHQPNRSLMSKHKTGWGPRRQGRWQYPHAANWRSEEAAARGFREGQEAGTPAMRSCHNFQQVGVVLFYQHVLDSSLWYFPFSYFKSSLVISSTSVSHSVSLCMLFRVSVSQFTVIVLVCLGRYTRAPQPGCLEQQKCGTALEAGSLRSRLQWGRSTSEGHRGHPSGLFGRLAAPGIPWLAVASLQSFHGVPSSHRPPPVGAHLLSFS